MDVYSKQTRSWVMRAVKSKDTKPEMIVRRYLHRSGYRYRLHKKELPGTPDIVFPRLKKVIFIHGCFWHQHPGCKHADRPSSNTEYWRAKLDRNVERDAALIRALQQLGWECCIIWECQTRNPELLRQIIQAYLPIKNVSQDDDLTGRSLSDAE